MGLIHLDAGVIIAFLDRNDVHHDGAREVLADALHDGDRLAMASSAFAECLVGPARRGALVIATAIEDGADELVTTDRKWPTARALKFKATLKHL